MPKDFIYGLAVAPEGRCFAARESGLYRSDDGGNSWHSAYDALKLNIPVSTTALAISPAFAQDRTLFAAVSGGVLRSTDGAQTWSAIPLPEPPPILSALAFSPVYSDDGVVLATSFARGAFYSTDRGETWWKDNYALLDPRILALAISPNFAQDHRVLIGTETGVFSSINGGRSWEFVDVPYIAVPSVAFAPNGIAYAGTDGDGMYTSADNGRTWTRSTLENTLSINLILTPSERDLLVFADTTLYRSLDAGATWMMHELPSAVSAAVLLNAARLLVGYSDGTIGGIDLQG
ncbi:MAG: YCF48-related protein [Chloroflexota bacterium]